MNKSVRRLSSLKAVGYALLLFSLALMQACYEEDTTVQIDGNNPPTFRLSGSGNIMFLWVEEVAPENQRVVFSQRDSSKDKMLWQVWPNDELPDTRVRRLPPITYGKAPLGFTQKIPERGEPPVLTEGKIYAVGVPSSNADFRETWFTIREGKSVIVPVPGEF